MEPAQDKKAKVRTRRPVNLAQLAHELGGAALGGPRRSEMLTDGVEVLIWADDVSQAKLEEAIRRHVADPDWRDPSVRALADWE